MILKIWYISAYDAPEGQSSRTYDYATELTNLGHKVTFFTSSYSHFTHEERLTPDEKWREEWFGNIRVIWLKTFPYKDNGWQRGVNMLSNAWRSFWVGRQIKEKPDIIFGPSVPLFTGLSAYFLSKIKRSRFVFEVRDIWPQALIDLGLIKSNGIIDKVLSKIEVFLYKKAKKIIAVLPFAHIHITKFNIDKEKIIWIPNGVNLRRFSESTSYIKPKDSFTIMYIGSFAATHEIQVILNAAKHFQKEGNKKIKFIIVGGGKRLHAQKDHTASDNLENVEFRGSISKGEIAQTQEEADVLVASVKDTPVYQFGINSNKIFDYLASGRPIIFAGNSPNDPISDASAGISIPPEDTAAMIKAIQTLFTMPSEDLQQLGKNGRHYAENNFDIRILAKKLERTLFGISDHN